MAKKNTKQDDAGSTKRMTREQILKTVLTGILAAIVVVLQFYSGYIKFGPFSITLALVPIIVGGAICGPLSGAFLGFVFSVVVLLNDAAPFLAVSVVGTVLTVLLKGTLAGLVSGLVYKVLGVFKGKKSVFYVKSWLRALLSSIVCPLVNTGLFVAGCYIFFLPTINEWAKEAGFESAGKFIVFGMIGVNFLVELATVILLSPLIVRLIELASKRRRL